MRPVGANARKLLESFQRTGGINRFMDYVFFQVAAINGFDSFGHYLRAGLIVNQCANYAIQPAFGCSANFRAPRARAPRRPPPRRRATRCCSAPRWRSRRRSGSSSRRRREPEKRTRDRKAADQEVAPEPTATPTPTPAPTPAPQAPTEEERTETLLDYLFGGDE